MLPGAGDSGSDIDVVLDILSRPDDDDLADVVELVAKICDAEAAGLTILRGASYHVPVTYGIDPFVSPSSDTFCQHTMSTEGVFSVEDARSDPRFAEIGWVNGTVAQARFYASAPIYAPTGEMVGRLCVIDPEARPLTTLQQRSLETLAMNVTQLIELRMLRTARPAFTSPESGQTAATVISQLAAELSHDLRVPLSSIIASIELLEDELGEQSTHVEALLNRTARAAGRMERMLQKSMHGTEIEESAFVDVDLAQVAHQLVLSSGTLLDASGASVEVGELPVVRADPDGMYSVLQNLLTNSVKFARPGVPVEVHVFAQQVPGAWRISVRDNGIGIPEDRRVDVFSLFSRVESDVEGHGIGLATVARIIASHGGRAGAESSRTGGAEIWFEIPDDLDERVG